MTSSTAGDQEIFKILVASDIHLGYGEKLANRSEDSFNSFEELLQIGRNRDVDIAIFGGDLFHENKPSRASTLKALQILNRNVLGDKDVQVEYLSNPEKDYEHCTTKQVNYEDPNMNIALPVFSIHGNHDDPCGMGGHSCLDLLHESRLVNYFGKISNLKEIEVVPILLRKGGVRIALYGLSHVKDERLHRLLREDKVTFKTPSGSEEWFNILVLHQNRAKRGPTNYIPESFLPDFFHLVIWGHEHDCRIEPEGSEQKFHIIQPGSPVATSLCEGESKTKKVGILSVRADNKFKLEAITLQTVRPMSFKTISLMENKRINLKEKNQKKLLEMVERELKYEVEDMIREAEDQLTGHPKQGTKPLIRLRVEYTDESQQINPTRFGNNFLDRVVNASEIIKFIKWSEKVKKEEKLDPTAFDDIAVDAGRTMEDLLLEYFENQDDEKKKMRVLSVRALSTAVNSYIQKNDTDAISYIVQKQLDKTHSLLMTRDVEVDQEIEDELERMQGERTDEQELRETEEELNSNSRQKGRRPPTTSQEDGMSDDDDAEFISQVMDEPPRGGRKPATSAAKTKTTSPRGRRGRGAQSVISSGDEDDMHVSVEDDLPAPPPPTRGRGSRGRGARGARKEPSTARSVGGGRQQSIMAAFAASQSSQTRTSSRISSQTSTQSRRNKKQMFDSDSD